MARADGQLYAKLPVEQAPGTENLGQFHPGKAPFADLVDMGRAGLDFQAPVLDPIAVDPHSPLADHPLRPATDRSLGKPLPYQQANLTWAHLLARAYM